MNNCKLENPSLLFGPLAQYLGQATALSPCITNNFKVSYSNSTINQYSFILLHGITTDTNTVAIYIAGLECSTAEYPECPAANDLFVEHN